MKTAAISQRQERNGRNTGFAAWPDKIVAAWSPPLFPDHPRLNFPPPAEPPTGAAI
jgi:hypothetical protein